jgi:hypothetical protein
MTVGLQSSMVFLRPVRQTSITGEFIENACVTELDWQIIVDPVLCRRNQDSDFCRWDGGLYCSLVVRGGHGRGAE